MYPVDLLKVWAMLQCLSVGEGVSDRSMNHRLDYKSSIPQPEDCTQEYLMLSTQYIG